MIFFFFLFFFLIFFFFFFFFFNNKYGYSYFIPIFIINEIAIIEVLLPIFCLSLFLLSIDFELLLLSILFVFLFSDISIFELLLEILLLIEDLLFKGSSQFPLFSFILLSFSILLFLE